MTNGSTDTMGFFSSLVDFQLKSFVTLKFIKVLYALAFGLIVLVGLFFFIYYLSKGGGYVAVAVIGVPLVTLLYLLWARISLELVALFFRIGENTSLLAKVAAERTGAGPAPFGPPSES
jgi:hypothetical protein